MRVGYETFAVFHHVHEDLCMADTLCIPEHAVEMKHAKSQGSVPLAYCIYLKGKTGDIFPYPSSEVTVTHHQEMVMSFDPNIAKFYCLTHKALRIWPTHLCILKCTPFFIQADSYLFPFIDLHNKFSLQPMSVCHNFKTLHKVIKAINETN